MSTNINSTEQIVEINAGDQITNVNIVSQSTTQVISGEQVVTVDVNAGTIPAAWGSITGTLSNQTDLQNALNAKQNNITLTTTGTTGVATLVGATLNIPNYVTSTKQTEWDSAYNDKINSAEVSGTTTKTLTLTQQDGGIIQASWSDFDTAPVTSVFGRTGDVVAAEGDYNINQLGDVTITSATNGQVLKYNGTAWVNAADASGLTSVGLEMPSAFTVSGSPLTSNGTITVTGAGTTSQYVRGDGSLAAFPSVSNEAKTLIREVYNKTGATLTKGTVIYIDGGQGNLPTVTKAIATGDPTSAQTFGIVQSDITNMNNGFVVVAGGIENLDTQAYTEGTALYLSPTTAGAWTSTKPYAPDHMVYLGVVVRSHPTQGVIEVKIQNGVELDEIHDVSARFPTNKDGIFYNSTSGVWENKSIEGVLGYTPVPESRIITINGTAQNLSADRTWNVGTVTQVAASGGTGISVAGSPVTGSGTITITNTAPDQVVGLTGAGTTSISGTYPNFTITSNDQYTGTVTSVAASGGTGISISGSPITSSGTINITNTAPDQIVSLTGAGTTSISGTYPNFTVTSNDQYVGTVTSVNATVPTGFEVSGVPITSSGTVDIKFASGYSLPTNAKQGQWDDAYAKRIDSLTVTGNSGSASLTSNILNVPTYTLSGLGGEPAITAGTTLQYWRGDKSFQTLDTSVVPENGPIYFTEQRVRATVLSGLNITGGSISASDNILNAFGKVQNQINGLIGGSIFQSTWNADTNTPTLTSSVGTKGYYYIVSVAGTTSLNGINDWQIGDWAIFDGTVWRKVDNTDAVVSVNGFTGVVNLALDNISDVSAASPTGGQLLRFNGTSSNWENWTPTYISGNQTITLSGDVTGTGTTAITTSIGAGKVTNAMLAGSINYAKMDSATVPTWNQDTTGNAATADKWKTARTLTIGATGKSVDGSGNVTWSASEIGLTDYLPLTGGTLTGGLIGTTGSFSDVLKTTGTANYIQSGNYIWIGGSGQDYGSIGYNIGYTSTSNSYKYVVNDFSSMIRFDSGGFVFLTAPSGTATNAITYTNVLSIAQTGAATFSSTISASNFSGSSSGTNTGDQTDITGNAGTATKLATARTLTIGATGKTFDGSANVTWSASDIGLNNYLPLTGGTLTGTLNGLSASFTGSFTVGAIGLATTPANSAGWRKIGIINSRGGGRLILSLTGGAYTPVTYVINYYKNWTSTGTLNLEKYGSENYITDVRIRQDNADNLYYIEINCASDANGLELVVYDLKILGYNSTSTIYTGSLSAGSTSGTNIASASFPTSQSGVTILGRSVFGTIGGTWDGAVIGSVYGGAGTVNGILKANGSGTVSAAVAGTDYVIPSALNSYLPLSGGDMVGNITLKQSAATNINDFTQKASFTIKFNGNYWNSLNGSTELYTGQIFGIPNSSNVNPAPSTRIVVQAGSTDTIYALSTGVVRLPQYTTNGFVKFSSSDGTLSVDTNTYLTGTGSAGQVTYWGASGLLGETNLFWDETNNRLGVGTNTPSTIIHVYKATDAFTLIETGGGNYSYMELKTPESGSGYIIKNIATGNSVSDKSLYLWNDNGVIELVPSADVTKRLTVETTGALTVRGSITGTISALATAATNFLTSDSGTIKSRTAAQVRSDIGAAAATDLSNYLPLSGGTLTGNLTLGNGSDLILTPATSGSNATLYNDIGILESTLSFRLRNGAALFLNNADNSSNWQNYNYTDNTLRWNYNGSGSDEMTLTSGGYLGVNTSSPVSRFHVIATSEAFNAYVGQAGTTVASILPHNGSVYISAGTYYENNAWTYIQASGSSLFNLTEISGVTWYCGTGTSYNNVASNIQLWDAYGYWKSLVRSTYAGDSYITGGNFGIGTASPIAGLDVRASSSNLSAYFLNSGADFKIVNATGLTSIGTSVANPIAILTSDTERMRITSGGNVGIGTTSPSTQLEVLGTDTSGNRTSPYNVLTVTAENPNAPYSGFGGGIVFKNRSYTYGLLNSARIRSRIDSDSNTNRGADLVFETTDSAGSYVESMYLKYTGFVGIGTSTPSQALVVNRSGASNYMTVSGDNNSSYDICHLNTDGTNNVYFGMMRGSTTLTGAFTVWTGGAGRLHVTSGGQLGLNTISPLNTAWGNDSNTKHFSIYGSAYAVINLEGANGGTARKYSMGVGDGSFYMCYDNTANRHNITVNSSGEVLIGGTDYNSYKLQVAGDIFAGGGGDLVLSPAVSGGNAILYNDTGGFQANTSITATSFFESSDMRLKSNIQDYEKNDILNVSAKIYEKDGKIEVGYLAQDLYDVLDSAISQRIDGYLDLSYRQVHTAKIAALENKIKELEKLLKNK